MCLCLLEECWTILTRFVSVQEPPSIILCLHPSLCGVPDLTPLETNVHALQPSVVPYFAMSDLSTQKVSYRQSLHNSLSWWCCQHKFPLYPQDCLASFCFSDEAPTASLANSHQPSILHLMSTGHRLGHFPTWTPAKFNPMTAPVRAWWPAYQTSIARGSPFCLRLLILSIASRTNTRSPNSGVGRDHLRPVSRSQGVLPSAPLPKSSSSRFRFPFPLSGFWFPVSGFRFPVSGFQFPVSVSVPVPVSGSSSSSASSSGSRFRFPVSGFWFPVSGFRLPVSGSFV